MLVVTYYLKMGSVQQGKINLVTDMNVSQTDKTTSYKPVARFTGSVSECSSICCKYRHHFTVLTKGWLVQAGTKLDTILDICIQQTETSFGKCYGSSEEILISLKQAMHQLWQLQCAKLWKPEPRDITLCLALRQDKIPSLEHVIFSEYLHIVRSMETADTTCDILQHLVKSKVLCAKLLSSSTAHTQ
jgi:hypothetical protein